MNFEYEYDNRGNIISEKRNGLITKYQYDALGQLIYVNDPHENAIWYYTYDCGGNILEKKKYARNTDGTTGTLIETIPYEYGDSNWKDKLTKYNGKTITYDAIGNPLDDGERQYEWEAGRRLKKVTVKDDPANGIKDGYDAGSRTTLKLNFSNGNLFADGVTSTTVTAKVCKGERDITGEYAASAFVWTRNTGNASADAAWNAAHKGMKSVALSKSELTASAKVTCTLSGVSPSFGTVTVDGTYKVSHTRAEADENDTLHLENGILSITTEANAYQLEGNSLTANHPQLNGTVTAEAWVYTEVPTKVVEFKYNSEGLRVQKKVTANGETVVTDYVLHGKLITEMTCGNDKLHFFYDAQNRPTKVNYNGKLYSYVHNIQGDVVGIVDANNEFVVEYKYDAWGTVLNAIGTLVNALGKKTPFAYRGYIFDEETGLYYLRSRYYNMIAGRFVNADIYIGKIASLGQHNQYSYCANVPVALCDENGKSFQDRWNNFWADVKYRWMYENQINFWTCVSIGLLTIGCDSAADLLSHSLQPNPPARYFSDGSSLVKKIKNDSDFKSQMGCMIAKKEFNVKMSMEFESDYDLLGAIHSVSIIVSPVTVNGKNMYHVTMMDRYDFRYENDHYPAAGTLVKRALLAGTNLGNNLAYFDSKMGAINEYDITIDFYVE